MSAIVRNFQVGQPVMVLLTTAVRGKRMFIGTIISTRGCFLKVSNETKEKIFPAYTYVSAKDVFPIHVRGDSDGYKS
ncbi:hypothetical protein NVP1293O_50 [Vibrio phage 1.293.O._10N.261.52.E1]|nr:hypothetical protein NVP1293O_50 [Vibrio phage 1.293.O._10N.261.52.E1]